MDKSTRVVGMAVFALGIIVLLFVFAIAYTMFASPGEQLFPQEGGPLSALGLGNAVVIVFVRVALLFVMTLAGSLIAARGMQLHLGGADRRQGPERAVESVKTSDETTKVG